MRKKKVRFKIQPRLLKLNLSTLSLKNLFVYILMAVLTNCYAFFFLLILSLLDLFFETHFFAAFYSFGLVLLSISIEETFHVISSIVLNRQAAIIGITIRTLHLFGCPVLCCGAAVKFMKSQLTISEHALIAFGGAFCSFFCSFILLTILCLVVKINALILISLMITPIISLLPSRYEGYVSDGFVVVNEIKRTKTIKPFLLLVRRISLYLINKVRLEGD